MKNNEPDKYNEITNRLLKEYKAEIIPHSITEKIFSEKIILYDASGTAISRENPLWVPVEIEYKTTITEIIEKAVKEMPFDRKPSNEDIVKAFLKGLDSISSITYDMDFGTGNLKITTHVGSNSFYCNISFKKILIYLGAIYGVYKINGFDMPGPN